MGLDLFVPSLAVWSDLCFELLLLGSVLEACLTWLELLSVLLPSDLFWPFLEFEDDVPLLATVPSEPVFFGFGIPLSVLPDDLLESFLFESFLAVEPPEFLPFEEFCVPFLSWEPVLLPLDDFEFEAVVVEEESLEEFLSLLELEETFEPLPLSLLEVLFEPLEFFVELPFEAVEEFCLPFLSCEPVLPPLEDCEFEAVEPLPVSLLVELLEPLDEEPPELFDELPSEAV